jgi:hypothetical protein
MSSQVKCIGKSIVENTLKKCGSFSNEKYCCNHKNRYRLEKPDDCPICMEHISEETETPLECGHWFHKSCLIQTNKKCPLCRSQLKQHEIQYIYTIQEVSLIQEVEYLDISDFIQNEEEQNENEEEQNENEEEQNENEEEQNERYLLGLNNLNVIQNLTSEILLNNTNNPYVLYSLYSYISNENYVRFLDYVHRFIETSINSVNISFRNLDLFETSRIASIIFDNSYDNNLLAISFNILHYTDHNITHYYYMRIEQVIIERINEIYNLL